ncbi:sigma-70 family RNA polymerase sigma factor [Agromyces tardus]|jgi:RNA polymerase sigma-70 factor (ECF subfamily)|uniref:Sigma-70 family RNA polymerase sigma factor n=1 Tax=Agromyces tardus TaxID=2583849 RepID=A0A3M8AC11_9MICO|nr:sigma-70 family RNA polymerase sigma factor [Agromyces tardus]RNB48809.1 sigma-70 family RNA polymerase sigma factor [Agromyces tardus]
MADYDGALSRSKLRGASSSRAASGGAARAEAFPGVLLAAQSGAQWACTNLWVDYAPAVMAFLRARGSHEPEDLTSEVFLAVFDQLDRFRGGEPEFRTFVFTIAYRRLVDELRRRSARGIHEEWSEELDTRRSPSAEHEATTQLADAATRALLDGLPPDQRNVMVLRIIADLTVEQVAAVLGKRPGAVKALQRRALESLRRRLAAGRTPPGPSDDSRE